MIKNNRLTILSTGIEINKQLPKYKLKKSSLYKPNMKDGNLYVLVDSSEDVVIENDTNDNLNVTFLNPIGNSIDYPETKNAKPFKKYLMETANNLIHEGGMIRRTFGFILYGIITGRELSDVVNVQNEPIIFDINDFFEKLKTEVKYFSKSQKDIDALKEHFKTSHHTLSVTGQVALCERFADLFTLEIMESTLAKNGCNVYLNESSIIKFAKQTRKGLTLTYIKNFTRNIPVDIVKKIDELNKLYIFDNYVILHYDPKGKSHHDTKEEIERKKDPILFGLIDLDRADGDHRLYYIGDWVDEYCDLTLDKLITVVGKKEKKTLSEIH